MGHRLMHSRQVAAIRAIQPASPMPKREVLVDPSPDHGLAQCQLQLARRGQQPLIVQGLRLALMLVPARIPTIATAVSNSTKLIEAGPKP